MARSKIWAMPREEFAALVQKSQSIADVLRNLGFAVTGRTHRSVKDRCLKENIDISHIPLGVNSNKFRTFKSDPIPLEQVMVEHSTYDRKHLKRRLIKTGLLENRCCICGQLPNWNGKTLVLVLDHINGIRDDHRLENLRLLCPNCNSQTATFCGRRSKKVYLCSCGATKCKTAATCFQCRKTRPL